MPWEDEEAQPVVHHSESRSLTITLSSPNYRFDIVETMDAKYVVRSRFAVGETVRLRARMTNKGDVKCDANFAVKDVDTGEVLFHDPKLGCVDPGKVIDANLEIGKMPNRNWNWLVLVAP